MRCSERLQLNSISTVYRIQTIKLREIIDAERDRYCDSATQHWGKVDRTRCWLLAEEDCSWWAWVMTKLLKLRLVVTPSVTAWLRDSVTRWPAQHQPGHWNWYRVSVKMKTLDIELYILSIMIFMLSIRPDIRKENLNIEEAFQRLF